jgi:hypothetical protein
MTNSQQTIKLDLSSLLTETSALTDNKYTSSALELLLLPDSDQSGGLGFGIFKNVANKVRAISPTRESFKKTITKVATKLRENSPTRADMTQALSNVTTTVRGAAEGTQKHLKQAYNSVRQTVSPRGKDSPRDKESPRGPRGRVYSQLGEQRYADNAQVDNDVDERNVGEGIADGIEQRVTQMEQDIVNMKQDIIDIKSNINEILELVQQLRQ